MNLAALTRRRRPIEGAKTSVRAFVGTSTKALSTGLCWCRAFAVSSTALAGLRQISEASYAIKQVFHNGMITNAGWKPCESCLGFAGASQETGVVLELGMHAHLAP